MSTPLAPMDALRPIDFTEALVRLQSLIGSEVAVAINFYERFFGCGLVGRLVRVETFPPDNNAIKVVLHDGQGFFLDPGDTTAFATGKDDTASLEFRFGFGASATVEPRHDSLRPKH